MKHQIIFGSSVLQNRPCTVTDPLISYPGRTMTGEKGFQVNEDILSKHILLLGGSGCGKTNAFCYTVDEMRRQMTDRILPLSLTQKVSSLTNFHSREIMWWETVPGFAQ